jgi:hypothetical protein
VAEPFFLFFNHFGSFSFCPKTILS